MKKLFFMLCLACMANNVSAQVDLRNARPEDIDIKTSGNEPAEQKSQSNTNTRAKGAAQHIISFKKEDRCLWVKTSGGYLRLQPVCDGVLRVSYGTRKAIDNLQNFAIDSASLATHKVSFKVKADGKSVSLNIGKYSARIDKTVGNITFLDAKGKQLVSETARKARGNVVGDSVCPADHFTLSADEALYGLGQFRDGRLNLRGCSRELVQFNTQAAIPVVYSTAGWGLFWNNITRTLFNDDNDGMTFISDYGNAVDYYIFVGESLDKLIARYRTLTGHVPMLPEWAMGFHQSRNRYHNSAELMQVTRRMAKEGIPMSSIFIDYHYWGKYGTGSMRFDESEWPNLPTMLDSLHNVYNTHVVITLWPCFKPGTKNYDLMTSKGFILQGARAIDGYVYDVFNPAARKEYRELIRPLLHQNIDGWFIDGPEPDHVPSFLQTTTAMGPAPRVRNIYPLLHIANFHKELSEDVPGKRPYILTRCAWAGQQRYGAAVWSGDIPATFDELRKQVTAGLDFTATGIPYWTTDIGGYLRGDPADKDYRELYARWFQYGTFCPIFRTHGRREPFNIGGPNELWAYGDTVQKICTYLVRLRYKLMPYIYSMTRMVSHDDYTPMRLLAFDFADDKAARDIRDEFMYGPAFLVCPVLEAGARSRQVYLPRGAKWIDYYTGKRYNGGQTITAEAPLERMPLFVKAGSIIPLAGDTVEVWTGANADFTLYEDDGETWAYRQGKLRETKMHWDEATHRLTVCPNANKKFTIKEH